MATFSERMIGAARLDAGIYEEVEADATAMTQAIGVVALSSLASGIGSLRFGFNFGDVITGTVVAFAAWMLWAAITYLVGTKIFGTSATHSSWAELLRTTGFSAAPGILRVLGFLPLIGRLVFAVTTIWMLVTFVVAIRQALDYTSTLRAVWVCLMGWMIFVAFEFVIF